MIKETVTLRIDKDIKTSFEKKADEDRRSLANWIITTCLKVIEK